MIPQKYECNLCGTTRFKYRHDLTARLGCDPQKYNVVKCLKCALHSLFPIPTIFDLQRIYADYAQRGDRVTVERMRMTTVYPNKINLVKKYVSCGNKILDIGAGIGGFATVAKREGFEVIGVEFEKQQCQLAKQLFDVDLICSTFEDFFKENETRYDVIHLHHVLEHLRDPKGTLSIARTILREGGILLLEVPNQFFVLKNELYYKLGKITFRKPYNPYHHLYFFSPLTLKRLLFATGFDVLELNEVTNNITKESFKRRINHFLSRAGKMGVSSRIEVVARSTECNGEYSNGISEACR